MYHFTISCVVFLYLMLESKLLVIKTYSGFLFPTNYTAYRMYPLLEQKANAELTNIAVFNKNYCVASVLLEGFPDHIIEWWYEYSPHIKWTKVISKVVRMDVSIDSSSLSYPQSFSTNLTFSLAIYS